ncbi:MAG: 1-deoxy-D-xylulose-5-phosphate reductoisomerase [Actinomyces sp.]|jgi:1-deoxy-D-xylulose 5-phosphate reductoisomerase|nr:1-deoxy-D-xylulose-5-phosphate reductoisomerase [Actinomyces sp.]
MLGSVKHSGGVVPVILLGSTGSIGTQAREVIDAHPGRFRVVGVSAGGSSIDVLAEQIVALAPAFVGVARDVREELDAAVRALGGQCPQVFVGEQASVDVVRASVERAREDYPGLVPVVLNGITGGVGLSSTLAALESGARLALANKESLVVGGALVKNAMRFPGQIVPVDSEHSAIAQALASGVHERGLTSPVVSGRSEVADLVLTASGGPFRGRTREQLRGVRAEQALAHPTWQMGPVVTINSSTLINKGLELIEAHLLFDVAPEHIIATVHPQSIVHSMVTWCDGATTLQASPPDMRLPIALGLTWPERLAGVESPLTWAAASQWTFEPVDNETFPAVDLARFAVGESATHPAVLNAANEVLVDAFIAGEVPWLAIVDTVSAVVHEHEGIVDPSLDDIVAAQRWADQRARELVRAGQWKDM